MYSFFRYLAIVFAVAALSLPGAEGMRNVRDFGAAGDGKTKDTAAIQRAVDAGGMVYFPPGTYLAGTIYLKSGGGLDLDPGATLLASPDREDYNADDFCQQNRTNYSPAEQVSGAHFIVALEQHDVTIRGGGTISGNQKAFFTPPKTVGPDMGWKSNKLIQGWRPSQMLFFCESDRVSIRDVNLVDPPYWSCYLLGCNDVRVDNVRVSMDFFSRNGDGISIDSCRNVTVSNCQIQSGDDALVIRSCDFRLKRKQPLENVVITNCILNTYCYGVRVGVGAAPIRNVRIDNIICRARIAVWIGPFFGQEKLIENCTFSNWTVDVEQAIRLVACNLKMPAENFLIRNLEFRAFNGTAALPIELTTNVPVKNVALNDILLRLRPVNRELSYYSKPPVWKAPVVAAGVDGLYLDNVRILWENPEPCFKQSQLFSRCTGLSLQNCDFGERKE